MDFLDEPGLRQLWEKIKRLVTGQTSGYALDSEVVHISGAETISGPKTFSGGVTVASGAVISGGAEVSGRFAISSGGADFEIPSGDPNDATKFLRGDGAWAEITSAASADTITTTLPISLGGTGESTKNMAVSALFNDNVGSNAAYLLGATSTFASAGYVDANDAKALLGITQSDIVSMIGTEPVASASTATNASSLGGVAASNYVTLNTDQNITGVKTFVGQKKIKFQQSGASDKLGFTLYNSAGVEQGYLEYNPTNKINGAPLMMLGNYASAPAGVAYVGFRKYSNITGSSGAYNLLTPLIADARTPFSLTTTYSNFFLPLGVTDGTSMVMTDSSGVLNISALLPSGYTLPPATTTSIGGVVIGSGLDVTSAGGISVDSAYVSSAVLDTVSSGGYITTSEASTIIADQISSGGYATTSEVESIVSNQISSGGYAVDSSVVHISGNETITGHKTFSSGVTVNDEVTITDTGNNLTRISFLPYNAEIRNNNTKFILEKFESGAGNTRVELSKYGSAKISVTDNNSSAYLQVTSQGLEVSGGATVTSGISADTLTVINGAKVANGMMIENGGGSASTPAAGINANGPWVLALANKNIVKGTAPSSTQYISLEFLGNTLNSSRTDHTDRLALVEAKVGTNQTTTMYLTAYGCNASNTTTQCQITCNVDSAGNAYTTAPTPATGDNSTKIATTAFVKAQNYAAGNHSHAYIPTSGGTLSGVISCTAQNAGFHVENGTTKQCSLLRGTSYVGLYDTKNSQWVVRVNADKAYVHYGSTAAVSDRRNKENITDISDSILDAWNEVEWKQFAYKGIINNKTNIGLIAQDVDEIFKNNSLNTENYPFFEHEVWEKDEEHEEAGDQYFIHYTEALCVEAAYQRRRADRAEARISALEQRLAEMEQAIAALAGGDE